jgi:hypothetical protein
MAAPRSAAHAVRDDSPLRVDDLISVFPFDDASRLANDSF